MKKSFVIATCEICGQKTLFENNSFHAIGAITAWCTTCCPEQEVTYGDGGESPHHVVGIKVGTPMAIYIAWKASPNTIPRDRAIEAAQLCCNGRKHFKDCTECLYDPCCVQELFED